MLPFSGVSKGAVLTLDAALRYTSATDEAMDLLHMTRETLIGRHCWEVYPAWEHTPLGALMEDVLRARIASELRMPAHDRPGKDVITRVVPHDDGGIRVVFRFATRLPLVPSAMVATR